MIKKLALLLLCLAPVFANDEDVRKGRWGHLASFEEGYDFRDGLLARTVQKRAAHRAAICEKLAKALAKERRRDPHSYLSKHVAYWYGKMRCEAALKVYHSQ